MVIRPFQIVYHFASSKEITDVIAFNPAYEDLDVIPVLQRILDVPGPLVITCLEWDWRTRTLEVWVRQEKVR